MTPFSVANLLLEGGNKCFELYKSLGFMHEPQFALQDDWNEETMYQNFCHVAMEHDNPLEGNSKSETQTMNAIFGKKFHFDFKIGLVEETNPSDSTVWSRWTGIGSSGMDAVAQANGIDKTQLSNGHRKKQRKRTCGIELTLTWNLIQGMEKNVHLK